MSRQVWFHIPSYSANYRSSCSSCWHHVDIFHLQLVCGFIYWLFSRSLLPPSRSVSTIPFVDSNLLLFMWRTIKLLCLVFFGTYEVWSTVDEDACLPSSATWLHIRFHTLNRAEWKLGVVLLKAIRNTDLQPYHILVKCIFEIPSLQINMRDCSSREKTPSNPECSDVIREWIVACWSSIRGYYPRMHRWL